MKIQAVGKNVAVELTPRAENSPGGIYIPELSREVTMEGRVLSVGAEVSQVGEGDIVGVPKYSGTIMEVNKAEVVILPQEKLLYVREPEPVQ